METESPAAARETIKRCSEIINSGALELSKLLQGSDTYVNCLRWIGEVRDSKGRGEFEVESGVFDSAHQAVIDMSFEKTTALLDEDGQPKHREGILAHRDSLKTSPLGDIT